MMQDKAPERATRRTRLLLGLAIVFLAGCPTPSVVERRCNSDFDCGGNERCAEGLCVEQNTPQPEAPPRDAGQPPEQDGGDVEPDSPLPEDGGPNDAGQNPNFDAGSPSLDAGPTCGNGRLEGDEACDDGNLESGDGCSDCATDEGYFCQEEPSVCESGSCTIDGEEVVAGAVNPDSPCQRCIPSNALDAWSTAADETPCDNGVFCDGPDTCRDGACAPAGRSACPSTTPNCEEESERCTCDDVSCSDGLLCNGEELCSADGNCESGEPLCPAGDVCLEGQQGACVECDTGADCVNAFCSANTCVETCPEGEAPDVNGTCTDAVCPDGQVFGYQDVDQDQVGVEPQGCFENAASVAGDCNDDDANIGGPLPIHADEDGDGFTALGGLTGCVSTQPAPPPVVGFRPHAHALTGVNGSAIGACDRFDSIARRDDVATYCSAFAISTTTISLGFRQFDIDVSADATILGIEITVRRQRTSNGPGSFEEVAFGLKSDAGADVVVQEDRVWSSSFEDVVYGGPTETFGVDWTPEDIASLRFRMVLETQGPFGVFDGILIDAVEVRVFTDKGEDCNDSDETVFTAEDLFIDEDGDGRSPELAPTSECVGSALPPGTAELSLGNDCLDTDADVYEGQQSYFGSANSVGTFDYNCDNTEEKQSVDLVDSCECDPSDGFCYENLFTTTPSQDCGARPFLPQSCEENEGVGTDGGVAETCSATPPCEVRDSRTTIRCR